MISAVLSIPALRVTGPYLAMVTIAFGFIVESVLIEWQGLTGGSSGLAGIPAPFGTGGTALLACALCVLALALFHTFTRSPLGLAMQATATAPAAARGIGIGALPVRTAAFMLAAIAAGLAGRVAGSADGFHRAQFVSVLRVDPGSMVVVVGGAGRTLGPLVGAVVVVLLPELLASLPNIVCGFRRGIVDRSLGRARGDCRCPCTPGDHRSFCARSQAGHRSCLGPYQRLRRQPCGRRCSRRIRGRCGGGGRRSDGAARPRHQRDRSQRRRQDHAAQSGQRFSTPGFRKRECWKS